MDYLNLVMYASISSFFLLFLIVLFQGKLKELKKNSFKDYLNSALLGFLSPFLYYIILFKAYSLLPAQVAQPLNMVWPIVLVVLSVPMLGHKIKLRSYIALFLSFIGVILISSQGDFIHITNSDPLGVTLALGSSLIWALFFILNVRDKRDEEIKLLLNFFFSSVFILTLNLAIGDFKIPEIKGVMAGVYVGVFEMGITYLFWLKALKLSKSSDLISNLVFLAPFISLIFIHFILGEKIFITTILGLCLIVFGIIFQKIRSLN